MAHRLDYLEVFVLVETDGVCVFNQGDCSEHMPRWTHSENGSTESRTGSAKPNLYYHVYPFVPTDEDD